MYFRQRLYVMSTATNKERSALLVWKKDLNMKSSTALRPFSVLTLLGVIALNTLLLSGCNTMEGAGKDIERAGEKVQDASNR